MAFTGLGAGTDIDPFQITTIPEFNEMSNYGSVAWFKLMNNLDFGTQIGTAKSINIAAFTSHLDGNNKELQNLTVGNNYIWGFILNNGSSIKDLTLRITDSVNNVENNKERLILGKSGGTTLTNVSITGIHVITSGTGQLTWFSDHVWDATCTINNIVLEGDIQGVFINEIRGLIEHVKVLRIAPIFNIYYSSPFYSLVYILKGEMRYCQHIIKNYKTISSAGLLVYNLFNGGKITESWANAKFEVEYADVNTTLVSHGLVATSSAASGSATEIKDSYYNGIFSVNGGEITSAFNDNNGKSGYLISNNKYVKINRCLVAADIITPLNDNRTVFTKETSTIINNCFYNQSKLTQLTAVDVANRQIGLSDAQYKDSLNFTSFDFDTVWVMGTDGPELMNNPLYAYETSLTSVQVTSSEWSSGTSFIVNLLPEFTSDYGVEIYNEADVLIDTKINNLINTITVPELDTSYTLKPFYMDGAVKVYTTPGTYTHYVLAIAFASATVITPVNTVSLGGTYPAQLVHGSILHNGYIYGTTRGSIYYPEHGVISRAPEHNLNAFENIVIRPAPEADYPDSYYDAITNLIDRNNAYANGMEQIVLCGGYLYTFFTSNTPTNNGSFLCQYNPVTNDYKVFRITGNLEIGSAPLISDGEYLYFCSIAYITKVHGNKFVGDYPKYNIDTAFVVEYDGVYDNSSQGGYILGGYPLNLKGIVHSGICDGEFLYASYTTDSGTIGGYSTEYDVSACEVHKVRKSDMTAAGFAIIPKSTDDMSQNTTHLFYGTEFPSNVDSRAYGYGWGGYAVRKSDMVVLGLPRYDKFDLSPVTASYASLIFGNYLLDTKTNYITYILDISDVDSWSLNEPIGNRVVNKFNVSGFNGAVANEFLLAEDGTFYAFAFTNPSYLAEIEFPELNFFAAPTINTLPANNISNINLIGYVLNNNSKPILSRGFRYGLSPEALTNTILSGDTTNEFSVEITESMLGTYYFQAFATNSEGESAAEIRGFSRLNYHWRFKVISNGKTVYGDDNQVISFKNLTL